MSTLRYALRQMSYLAARYTGRGDVHVVDPNVDLRYLFENSERLRRSLEERRIAINISEVKEKYESWWNKYQTWKAANDESKEKLYAAKKAMRDEHAGLLAALALPNFVHEVGKTEKQMLKKSNHQQYLAMKGHLHVDNDIGVVHLSGYPVLLLSALKTQLLDMFPDAMLVSPSCFARAAVLEAVNVPLEEFLRFNDGSPSFPSTYLGDFNVKTTFTNASSSGWIELWDYSQGSNQWPITLQSAGAAYFAKKRAADLMYSRQRMKHCVLSLASNDGQVDGFMNECTGKIGALIDEGLLLNIKLRRVLGKELRNYESKAIVIEDSGLELARISRIDDYISRRLNITTESDGFVRMAYAETDVNRLLARLIDGLVDGKDVPKILRDYVRAEDLN